MIVYTIEDKVQIFFRKAEFLNFFRNNKTAVRNFLVVFTFLQLLVNCWFLFHASSIIKFIISGAILYLLFLATNYASPYTSYSIYKTQNAEKHEKSDVPLFDILLYSIFINAFIYLKIKKTSYKLYYFLICFCAILLLIISENSLTYNVFHALSYSICIYFILTSCPQTILKQFHYSGTTGKQIQQFDNASDVFKTDISSILSTNEHIIDY